MGLKHAAGVCEVVAKDPNVDMIAWAAMLPSKAGAWDGVEALQAMVKRHRQADRRLRPHELSDDAGSGRSAGGRGLSVPAGTGADAARAQRALVPCAAQRPACRRPLPPAPPSDLTPATLDATLARYGIALPKSREVASAGGSRAAAEAIGFPVVLKIRSPDILHKTEAGGVEARPAQRAPRCAAAADALIASARAAQPNARIDGFLVQEMVSGVEAIVGARNDALYGPILLVGAGGVLVELAQGRGAAAAAGRRATT